MELCRLVLLITGLLASFGLTSCSQPTIELMDRHGLSWEPVADWARKHPAGTLVLFDYHHDCSLGPVLENDSTLPTSVDWVGSLVDRGLVSKVFWVSGKDLLLPNRNARLAWIRRKTSALGPARQKALLDRVTLVDDKWLMRQHLSGPVAATIDLDILTKNPGPDPNVFLDDMIEWILVQRPELVTVALSAAYQPDTAHAWSWLSRLAEDWPMDGWNWELNAGSSEAGLPESNEETAAWATWRASPPSWQPVMGSFRPNTGVWLTAPPDVREAVLRHHPRPVNAETLAVLKAWEDPDLRALELSPEGQHLDLAAREAIVAIETAWKGGITPHLDDQNGQGWGLAIRLMSGGHDRGCLALWTGPQDLKNAAQWAAVQAIHDPRYPQVVPSEKANLVVQPTLFGPWHLIQDPTDFVTGFHALMVVDGLQRTLLQPALVSERNWSTQDFLEALSRKAGLGVDGWKRPGLKWYRAVALWGNQAFTTPK